jgi:hypothetical protein
MRFTEAVPVETQYLAAGSRAFVAIPLKFHREIL